MPIHINSIKFHQFLQTLNEENADNPKLFLSKEGKICHANFLMLCFGRLCGTFGGRDMTKKELIIASVFNYLDYAIVKNKADSDIFKIKKIAKAILKTMDGDLNHRPCQALETIPTNMAHITPDQKNEIHDNIQKINKHLIEIAELQSYKCYIPILELKKSAIPSLTSKIAEKADEVLSQPKVDATSHKDSPENPVEGTQKIFTSQLYEELQVHDRHPVDNPKDLTSGHEFSEQSRLSHHLVFILALTILAALGLILRLQVYSSPSNKNPPEPSQNQSKLLSNLDPPPIPPVINPDNIQPTSPKPLYSRNILWITKQTKNDVKIEYMPPKTENIVIPANQQFVETTSESQIELKLNIQPPAITTATIQDLTAIENSKTQHSVVPEYKNPETELLQPGSPIQEDRVYTENSILPNRNKVLKGRFDKDMNGAGEIQLIQEDPKWIIILGSAQGTFKNGKLHGQGTYINKQKHEIYTGTFKEGQLDGEGKITSSIEQRYDGGPNSIEGIFKKGRLVRGAIKYSDIYYYQGTFGDGSLNLHGENCKFVNLDPEAGKAVKNYAGVKEGAFDQGRMHGQGKYTHLDGTVEEGQFTEGSFYTGRRTYPDGTYDQVEKFKRIGGSNGMEKAIKKIFNLFG